uniref:G_PROTEIN_RECEP_F1_2 domain-containing protein n=1 Tax=Steinernema glaseri TaxID=37863 RepID=A0A1I7ZBL3_9BILA
MSTVTGFSIASSKSLCTSHIISQQTENRSSNNLLKMEKCLDAQQLSESMAMKVVISIKIAINLVSSTAIIFTFLCMQQSRSYRIVHKNVRITLNFHIFYILLANASMVVSNSIDLNRLSSKHSDPCGYLLPLWVTFTVRETYMFGVLGQTFTFVILSIERIMATFMRTYEHLQSKNLIVSLISIKTALCIFFVYVYIGYDADWSIKTVQFFPQTEQNKSRIR